MKKLGYLIQKALLNAAFCRIMKQKRVTSTNLRLGISNKFEVVEHENVCYTAKKTRFRTNKSRREKHVKRQSREAKCGKMPHFASSFQHEEHPMSKKTHAFARLNHSFLSRTGGGRGCLM